jgi:hypothetical protein
MIASLQAWNFQAANHRPFGDSLQCQFGPLECRLGGCGLRSKPQLSVAPLPWAAAPTTATIVHSHPE